MKKKYLSSAQKAENETRAHKKGLVERTNVITNKTVNKHTTRKGKTLTFVY